MLIQPSQADVRRFFCGVYTKARSGLPLDAIETLASGWIDDQSTPVADLFGRLPNSQRAFFTGEINGRTQDGLEIAGHAFAQSDPDVLRDFRPMLAS